ncbi:MAG: oligopeptide transporter, OPT family [Ruminococcus sp.]|nr:oligopeptide transporter, OPT family [Ruminococcus sp.]
MDNKNKPFKPYVPADKITPEITVVSVILGVILSVVFGAANAYLGLKVGLTVSASIPAAVISMGVIRVIMRRNSILESNIVQTIGSAGESLAAGAIFTLPALFIWAEEGKHGIENPSILEITLIALIGGLLGVFFMIPLRNALIVKEHGTLPYPEGTACAEVLLAGEKNGAGAGVVFAGMGFAALFKFIIDGLVAVKGTLTLKLDSFKTEVSTQIYPALLSVGYICGPKISSYMFAGSILSWLVIIPLLVTCGGDAAAAYADGGAGAVHGSFIKYIGAGALAAAGIISLVKSLPTIGSAFVGSMKGLKETGKGGNDRTSKELNIVFVIAAIIVLTLAIWLIPTIKVNLIGALIIVVFGFFFATVSSRMVGLVGSSNNPVSGMAIATLLITTLVLVVTGQNDATGMVSAISIGAIICIVCAIAGDTSQDLKTGYILGATPKKQQIGEIIGVCAASLAIGGTLYLLNAAYGFGPDGLNAPQANLMKTIVEGIMGGDMPWGLVIAGAFIAVVIELIGIPVLPFAIGVYLPFELNACIMIGGIIRLIFDNLKKAKEEKDRIVNDGVLFCSGMIAGEGLIGILLALFAIIPLAGGKTLAEAMNLSAVIGISDTVMNIGSIVLFAIIILTFCGFTVWKKNKKA